jgi:hypothetical protein
MNIEALGGRKFVLALFSLVAGMLTHALSPKGLSTEVVAMIVGVLGTFSVANTVATVKVPGSQAAPIEESEPKEQQPALVDHSEQLSRIESTVEAIGKSALQTQQILVNAMQPRV